MLTNPLCSDYQILKEDTDLSKMNEAQRKRKSAAIVRITNSVRCSIALPLDSVGEQSAEHATTN